MQDFRDSGYRGFCPPASSFVPVRDASGSPGESDVIVTEESIEKNFKTFRSYIETCVKVTDFSLCYELFTTEQRKKYFQLFKSDRTAATTMAFDDIVQLENQPDKYTHLLTAMKDYPKLVRILKGELLPMGNVHRQVIEKSMKTISENLMLKEVLQHLLVRGVINQDDYEGILAAERNHYTAFAVTELLFILPNRDKDWYMHFIESLQYTNHEDLAKSIDDLTISMMENETIQYERKPESSRQLAEEHDKTTCETVKTGASRRQIPPPDTKDSQEGRMYDCVDGMINDCQTAIQKGDRVNHVGIPTPPPGKDLPKKPNHDYRRWAWRKEQEAHHFQETRPYLTTHDDLGQDVDSDFVSLSSEINPSVPKLYPGFGSQLSAMNRAVLYSDENAQFVKAMVQQR